MRTWRVLGAVLSWRKTRSLSGSLVIPCSGNFSLMKSQARVLMDCRRWVQVSHSALIGFVQVRRCRVVDARGQVRAYLEGEVGAVHDHLVLHQPHLEEREGVKVEEEEEKNVQE